MNNYRAWHDESKEYVYFDYKKMAKDQFQSQIFMDLASQDRLEISTRLFDKDNKELFSNDYISIAGHKNLLIFWSYSLAGWCFTDGEYEYDYQDLLTDWNSCRYSGNIHEGEK